MACGRIKKDCPEPELRVGALKTIYELYPIEQWLHIYTDGSASGINRGAGAGVYSINFQLSFPVGAGCDNYDAEMQAICFAMEATIECNDNTVIFSDSQAVMQQLRNEEKERRTGTMRRHSATPPPHDVMGNDGPLEGEKQV
ncbi:uncharacterized protein [Halyomorpha halys]|uniref:uncharacterized protein n=1 Tax=Halyomorpha halys TaxID=286706 RepID=UPI0034D341E7